VGKLEEAGEREEKTFGLLIESFKLEF